MATKKKSDVIMSADIAESLENKWPQIKKGNHLTVKTFENGHTVLEWDDEALTREVTNAILSVNQQENEDGNSKIGKQSKRQTSKSK
jgi:hypothetical protein